MFIKKLNEFRNHKVVKELDNSFNNIIEIINSIGNMIEINNENRTHIYTKEEVQEANNHPFVLAMNLKLEYKHIGIFINREWKESTGIFVDKKWKRVSTDMRVKDRWMLILKPEGKDLIEDLKTEIRKFDLKLLMKE